MFLEEYRYRNYYRDFPQKIVSRFKLRSYVLHDEQAACTAIRPAADIKGKNLKVLMVFQWKFKTKQSDDIQLIALLY